MKIKRMPRNMKIMKNFIQPGYSLSVNSPVPRKTPTSKRKETARMRSKTILAMTSLTMATNLVEAMTRKAIVNAAMELRFFLVYSLPSIFSMPRTRVFSKMAKTMVNTSKKGKTTS